MAKFESIEDIVEANREASKYFFAEETMEKFQTKLIDELFPHVGGDRIYFVTSDIDYQEARHYKVRVFSPKCGMAVWTPAPSAEMTFDNEADALEKAKALAEKADEE